MDDSEGEMLDDEEGSEEEEDSEGEALPDS